MAVLRPLRRPFGISARRVTVRPDPPWYWRWLRGVGLTLLIALCLWLFAESSGYGRPRASLGEPVAERPGQSAADMDAAVANARTARLDVERQLEIERAAGADLARQIKALTYENAALKEDLAFFQSLMADPAAAKGAISVNRFRLETQSVPGEYRYQMLLVQNGQRMREFHGSVQFILDVQHDGRKLVLILPPEAARGTDEYQLRFKFFQRIEGTFKLAPGSVLKGMQVRVFENGSRSPKLAQALNIT